jgi:hypothetical protein
MGLYNARLSTLVSERHTKIEFPTKKCVQIKNLAFDQDIKTQMDANSLLMNRFKIQSNKFSGTISRSLGKVKKRLVKEMIYGI